MIWPWWIHYKKNCICTACRSQDFQHNKASRSKRIRHRQNWHNFSFKILEVGLELIRWLKAPATIAEDPGWIHNPYMMAQFQCQGIQLHPLASVNTAYTHCIDSSMQATHTKKNKIKSKTKELLFLKVFNYLFSIVELFRILINWKNFILQYKHIVMLF